MLSRIKFKIDALVKEILDQLPKEVWTSKTTTFLDPAIAGGQFVREIERRLLAAGHDKDNVKQRVFGCEEYEHQIQYALNKYKLLGSYTVTNFLEQDFQDMKFDVVVGNPPYQKPKSDNRMGSRGASELWADFVRQGLLLLKDNGHFAFIHPNSWRKPQDRNNFWKLLTQDNQMDKLVMSSGKGDQDWFGIGVRVDYYILQKKKKYKNTTVIDQEGISHNLDLAKFDWLPNYAIIEIAQLLGKGTSVLYNTFYHTQKKHSDVPTKDCKYPVVHTINKSGLGIKYFDRLQEHDTTHYGVAKVLLNQNELQYPHNDYKGEYGMSQLTFGIAISSKEEGEEIIKFLNSNKGKRLIASTKWNTYYTDYGMFKSFKKDWYK